MFDLELTPSDKLLCKLIIMSKEVNEGEVCYESIIGASG